MSVTLDVKGEVINCPIDQLSGCALSTAIDSIGYKKIALYGDASSLIKSVDNETLLDSLCSDRDRDVFALIRGLFDSEVELNSENEKALKGRLNLLLDDVFKS